MLSVIERDRLTSLLKVFLKLILGGHPYAERNGQPFYDSISSA